MHALKEILAAEWADSRPVAAAAVVTENEDEAGPAQLISASMAVEQMQGLQQWWKLAEGGEGYDEKVPSGT